jgi:hypothetical protein
MADFEKIDEVVCASSQTTISFPTIPATYRDLELIISGRASAAAGLVTVRLQFNGDTGANYDNANTNRFSSDVFRGATFISLQSLSGSTAPTGVASSMEVFIPNYRGTVFQKTAVMASATKTGVSSDGEIVGFIGGGCFWRSTAAINAILLSLASGNFVDGSVATLYGKM